MRVRIAMFLLALVGACTAPEKQELEAWDAQASEAGPVLVGVVTHPDGTPLAGIEVRHYSGFATRFGGGGTRTDEHGRYRFDPISGSRILNEETQEWDHFVGVCVGSIRSGNPPEFLPWKDVRIPDQVGWIERLDFVFDPESVPPEQRVETGSR